MEKKKLLHYRNLPSGLTLPNSDLGSGDLELHNVDSQGEMSSQPGIFPLIVQDASTVQKYSATLSIQA